MKNNTPVLLGLGALGLALAYSRAAAAAPYVPMVPGSGAPGELPITPLPSGGAYNVVTGEATGQRPMMPAENPGAPPNTGSPPELGDPNNPLDPAFRTPGPSKGDPEVARYVGGAWDTPSLLAEYSTGKAWGVVNNAYVVLREYGACPTSLLLGIDHFALRGMKPSAGPMDLRRVNFRDQDKYGFSITHPFRATARVDTMRAANGAIILWCPEGGDLAAQHRLWNSILNDKSKNNYYKLGMRTPQACGGGRTNMIDRRWKMLWTWQGQRDLAKKLVNETAAGHAWRQLLDPAGGFAGVPTVAVGA